MIETVVQSLHHYAPQVKPTLFGATENRSACNSQMSQYQVSVPKLKDIKNTHKMTFSHAADSLLHTDASLCHQALSQTERNGEYVKREAERSLLMDI